MFCYTRYHLKKYSQVYELANNIQYLLIFNSSRKHKILHVFDHTFVFAAISCLYVSSLDTCSTENFNENKERIQKVKILLANIDTNAAGIFSICAERNNKVRNVGLGFEHLNSFLLVFIKLTEFSFIWNRNITLGINILKSHCRGICKEEQYLKQHVSG